MKLLSLLACCLLFSQIVFSQGWQRIVGAQSGAFSIGLNPSNNNTIWVGGRDTTYVSYDRGKTISRKFYTGFVSSVTQVLINPVDTSYIILVGKGCFASRDNGVLWASALPDADIQFNGEAIAYEPGKPDTMYAGLKHNNDHNDRLFFRSTNGGHTWVAITNSLLTAPAFCCLSAGGNRILLGGLMGNGSIVRSTDGGETWSQVYSHPNPDYEVPKIVFDKTKPGTVWALLWATQGIYGIVLKSTDYGVTWSQISVQGNPWGIDTDLRGFVYVGMLGTGERGVFISENSGVSWATYETGYPTASATGNVWNLKISNDGSILYVADFRQGGLWLDISGPLTSVEAERTRSSMESPQNYPNPFNPTTTIRFSLPEQQLVTLKIYSLIGHNVAELFNGELAAGTHEIPFHATNLPSGTYIYRLQAGSIVQTGRMVLAK